jgi:uncharacterized protein (TIGR00299 family) protein
VVLTKADKTHRNYKTIKRLIQDSNLSDAVKEHSIQTMHYVAQAEATVHNKAIDEVHFHEVGAIDSIIDAVATAVCMDYLKPNRVISSPVQLGGGMVTCAHGNYPVPAPATAEIVKHIPVKIGLTDSELTTPTGAAIVATYSNEFNHQLALTIKKTGYGLGRNDFEFPNVLRAFWEENEQHVTTLGMMECNLDDMNPEWFEFLIEKLLSEGALDVFLTPIIAKKSRPATLLSVLHTHDKRKSLESIILSESTTLGIRSFDVQRTELDRTIKTIVTRYGSIRVKMVAVLGTPKYKPELDDCKQRAIEHNVPLRLIYREVERIMNNQNNTNG